MVRFLYQTLINAEAADVVQAERHERSLAHHLTKRCAAPRARHHFGKRVSDTGSSLIVVDTNPFAKIHAASLTFTSLGPRLEASRAKWRRRPFLQPCSPWQA